MGPPHRSHQVQLYRRSIGAGARRWVTTHERQSTQRSRPGGTRTSSAAVGTSTELGASAREWSSTAFRRLCKAPNFFRTYSFGYTCTTTGCRAIFTKFGPQKSQFRNEIWAPVARNSAFFLAQSINQSRQPQSWGWPDFCHMLAQLFFCSFAQHHCNFRKTLAKVPDAVTVQPAGVHNIFTVKYLYFICTVFYSLYFGL